MKKIILAATGEELEWRDDRDGDLCLVRVNDIGVPRYTLFFGRIVAATYGSRSGRRIGWAVTLPDIDCEGGRWESVDDVNGHLMTAGIIKIIDEAEPQPGPSREEYLLTEARAIILDAVRNNFDYKRALRWIADSEVK